MNDETDVKVDEELYSRQLYVLGHEAMRRMMKARALVIGMDGLGQEIAKDLCLAGIYAVDICDPRRVEMRDLGAGFYLAEGDVGRRRDEAVLERLQRLNRYVSVGRVECGDLREYEPTGYDVVIAVNCSAKEGTALGERCHAAGVKYVVARVSGVFSQVFVDFGEHVCVDRNGTPPCIGGINDIMADGTLTLSDGSKHTLSDGDKVRVGQEVYEVDVLSRIKLRLRGYKETGGETPRDFEEVKDAFTIPFLSMEEAAKGLAIQSFEDATKDQWMHRLFTAEPEEEGAGGTEMAGSPKKICVKTQNISIKDCRERKIEQLFWETRGCLVAPMCSIVGGFAAQEALKGISGKFVPLKQFIYFDYSDDIISIMEKMNGNDNADTNGDNVSDIDSSTIHCNNTDIIHESIIKYTDKSDNDRYSDIKQVFGSQGFKVLERLRIFLVGAGAIGCEHMKNMVMTGMGREGRIAVTDMDSIERSNLNRQFLFSEEDVSRPKAESAARQAAVLNTDYAGTRAPIAAYNLPVNGENESVFSDRFFSAIDVIANALDNVEARNYMDERAVATRTPMFDSGTLGTKGHVQAVLPFRTESYSASVDAAEASVPMCTVKSYPSTIEHTIEWALGEFKTHFEQEIAPISNTEDCIKQALGLFVASFSTQIQKLLSTFPADATTKEGLPFWAPPKRPPVPISFNVNDKTHLLFIHSCANLYAACYALGTISREKVLAYIDNVFSLAEPSPIKFEDDDTASTAASSPQPIAYDKDSWHADFIYASANLRARNYRIKERSKLFIRGVSGKIIPAIATTTAVVSGLAIMEIIKHALLPDSAPIKNSFLDLAMPFLVRTDPIPPRAASYELNGSRVEYTEWSRIELPDAPLADIVAELGRRLGSTIEMGSVGAKMIYWASSDKYAKNANKTIAELASKKDGQRVQYVDFITEDDFEFERVAITFED